MQERMVKWFAERLPPLRRPKRPVVAAVVAVVFGGFGLAVYLRSWLDAAVAAVSMVMISLAIGAGFPIGLLAVLAGLAEYAYARVEASNRQLGGHPAAGIKSTTQPAT